MRNASQMQGENAECVRVSSFLNCRLIAAAVEWLGRSLPPGQTYPVSQAIVIAQPQRNIRHPNQIFSRSTILDWLWSFLERFMAWAIAFRQPRGTSSRTNSANCPLRLHSGHYLEELDCSWKSPDFISPACSPTRPTVYAQVWPVPVCSLLAPSIPQSWGTLKIQFPPNLGG